MSRLAVEERGRFSPSLCRTREVASSWIGVERIAIKRGWILLLFNQVKTGVRHVYVERTLAVWGR